MKIFTQSGFYLKNVPKHYGPIKSQIPDLILFEDKKRLTAEEVEKLNTALLQHYYQFFLRELFKAEPNIYHYIKEKKPIKLIRVTLKDRTQEFQIVLSDNTRIRCSQKDFYRVKFSDEF